ncbi:hypothetical protein ACT2CV_07830 [Pasteurellaceae bacterium 22721_9_1]
MKTSVNLLPWRLSLHKKRSRHSIILFFLFCIIWGCSWFVLTTISHHFSAQQTQGQIQQNLTQQLTQTEQKLKQLQQRLQHKQTQDSVAIASDVVSQHFQLLSSLPIQQGELTTLNFTAKELSLIGMASNQTEFEQIHHYLKEQPSIPHLQLAQFSPQTNESLLFEFKLRLTGMEPNDESDDIE